MGVAAILGPVEQDRNLRRFEQIIGNGPALESVLEHFIERSVILSAGSAFRPPLAQLKRFPELQSTEAITLEEAERDHIRKTLESTRWVVAGPNGAAARLGMKRSTLYFRMQKLGISRATKDPYPAA